MKKYISTLLLLLSFAYAHADSMEQTESGLTWSGFISQSLVRTSHGTHLSGNSDKGVGSFDRQEIGASASYYASSNIDLRGMVSIIRDGSTDSKPRANFAVVDIHTDDGMHGVRLGRYSYDYGFYNASRNNPAYRDFELPPQGLYREGFKYITRSGDGVQLYTSYHITQNYSADIDLGYGKPVIFPQQDIVQTFVLNPTAGKFTEDAKSKSANITISDRENGIVLKVGYQHMNLNFSTQYVDNGDPFPMTTKNTYIGVRKYFDFGDVTVENLRVKMGQTRWDSLMPSTYQWGGVEGWSITYKHYVTPSISALIGYDTWYVNKADKDGSAMHNNSGGTTQAAAMFEKSINMALVLRKCNYTLKAEFHRVHGTNTIRADGNDINNPNQPAKYNVFLFTATYLFR